MNDKIIIFGLGKRFEYLKFRMLSDDKNIVAYCDNDANKIGTIIDNKYKVISPKELNKYEYDKILITSDLYYEEIRNDLIENYSISPDIIEFIPSNKYQGELSYWRKVYFEMGNTFNNSGYESRMMSLADETNDMFWENKVVVDFGCGPQGTLTWTKTPAVKIGVDVLANEYIKYFGNEIIKHDMIYVTSSEDYIPIPDNYVDYLITINSLDHVYNLEKITNELLRILKKDGILARQL